MSNAVICNNCGKSSPTDEEEIIVGGEHVISHIRTWLRLAPISKDEKGYVSFMPKGDYCSLSCLLKSVQRAYDEMKELGLLKE